MKHKEDKNGHDKKTIKTKEWGPMVFYATSP